MGGDEKRKHMFSLEDLLFGRKYLTCPNRDLRKKVTTIDTFNTCRKHHIVGFWRTRAAAQFHIQITNYI